MFSKKSLDIIKDLIGQIVIKGNDPNLTAKAEAIAKLNVELAEAEAKLNEQKE